MRQVPLRAWPLCRMDGPCDPKRSKWPTRRSASESLVGGSPNSRDLGGACTSTTSNHKRRAGAVIFTHAATLAAHCALHAVAPYFHDKLDGKTCMRLAENEFPDTVPSDALVAPSYHILHDTTCSLNACDLANVQQLRLVGSRPLCASSLRVVDEVHLSTVGRVRPSAPLQQSSTRTTPA